ncbi:hypothetical protein KUTeg_001418 [Tegillarca granosa]|uniref:Uncharacterized protein n=1 Tax=Tegillarca granosa TaxID=220873 RepID=A0ABQ9FSV4_TEGGR|nr:hypothetical protein KUTeg_001418 [Tegillarca granosa]
MKKNEITFEGLTGDITQAKLEMYVLFQSIVSTKVGKFSDEKLKFLESVEVKKYISTILRQATVNAVWDIDAQQNVIMYSLSDDEGVKGAHILKDAIVETPISLKEEALCLLQSQKWQKAKWEIENRAPGLINIIPEADKSQVLIYTVSDYAGRSQGENGGFSS